MYVEPNKYQYGPYYEYIMPKAMAEFYLENRSDKSKNPHEYLVNIVNEQFRVWGTCVSVKVESN